jgi:hypothetical protein
MPPVTGMYMSPPTGVAVTGPLPSIGMTIRGPESSSELAELVNELRSGELRSRR